MITALLIFLVTLIFVIWQPKGLGIGWTASIGAGIALLLGVITVADIPVVWNIVWNATFAFIAIIIISLLLDEAGFFRYIALHVARLAKGSGNRLFAFIVLLGAVVSALFANDGVALILTPIVIAILTTLRFSPATTLAFVITAGFIADTASIPLVVSNLVNIVSADFFKIPFTDYAKVMIPVNVVAVVTSLLVLYGFYHKDIPTVYALDLIENSQSAIVDKNTFIMGWVVLALLLLGFFVLEPIGVPISFIAGVGALVLLVVAKMGKKIKVLPIVKNAPWQVVIFSLGMYLVVYGLKNAGLTDYLAHELSQLANHGMMTATVGTGLLSAGLSSAMNNMPTVLIQALAIDEAIIHDPMIKQAMIYANVIGCDLGTKITPIGSLATLLWLHVLASKNITVSWGYYIKVGIILTLPVLVATLVALAIWLPIIQ
ncbi:arsenic transporter [Moraxella osloensis]|uniref:Arsenical pump membrane protein n=1 Tax=Faucicola osloensis TaxID=34062 RepID=A0A378Q7Q1_FAUOS|nr:arsenic transporter [Moraxella osloensis]AME01168.1 arsenic transporter [Moraxella osloensis]OBX57124.1 arsenic transporter [Moraxella osloensis]QPT43099.1 arsenic transporter [Moraxella osloensis]STY96739.1 Arsenic efflux pump protein [Moraxella osloensis]